MIAGLIILLLIFMLAVAMFYLVRFVKIIMVIEDDIDNSIEILNRADKSIDGLLDLQMFFDDKELMSKIQNVKTDIKISKMAISKLISTFVQRSKNKYIIEEVEEQE